MKKIIIIKFLSIVLLTNIHAQKKPATEKVVAASEKVNTKSREISDASNKVADQARRAGDNAKNIAANVKAVIKVFEPILNHLKRKKKILGSNNDVAVTNANTGNTVNTTTVKTENNTPPPPASTSDNATDNTNSNTGNAADYETSVTENKYYNSDGTANIGNQNNGEYGNFLNAFTGTINDGYEAEQDSKNIDLVFLADQYGGYMLASPIFLKTSNPGFHYENVVKSWNSVNESEIALTTMTISEFEKIKPTDVTKFYSKVKQTTGYTSFYQSFTEKLKGKVFAIRSEMGGRQAYALMAVMEHAGTYGSSGYLKIKIKCTGIDNN